MSPPESATAPSRNFDEAAYLEYNPDVAAAVGAGAFESGREHYEAYGRAEGRVWIFEQTKVGRLLAGLNVANSIGMEIGALDKPLVKRSDGTIFYVDYMDTASLRNRYKNDPAVAVEKIVDVDGIWGERTLAEALGRDQQVDYVLASHVIEHVPDVVSWLREIQTVLGPHGSLRLVVPDRRFTFDYTRRESTLADALDAYIRKARAPLPRQILDYCLNARSVDVGEAWRGDLNGADLKRSFSDADAITFAREALEKNAYHDVHCWVFTPETFQELMRELVTLGMLDMRCDFISDTPRNQLEFLVSMSMCADRQAMLESWHNPIVR